MIHAFKELKGTTVIDGNYMRFLGMYVLYKLILRSKKYTPTLSKKLEVIGLKLFSRPIMIQNEIGCFKLQLNDSISKASPYFEKHLQSYLDEDIRKEDFVDIGANIGTYSFLATTKHGYNVSHAFEANPNVSSSIQDCIKKCDCKKLIKVHNIALGDTESELPFIQNESHTGASRLMKDNNETLTENEKVINVAVKTFDNIYSKLEIKPNKVSFIKIDVEGAELEVLRGMQTFLAQVHQGTVLFIEIWDRNNSSKKSKQFLQENGFKLKLSLKDNYLFIKGSN